jgi:hypothetical protein
VNNKLVKLPEVKVADIPNQDFEEALNIVRPIYESYGASDTAAKGVDMLIDLKARLKTLFSKRTKVAKSKCESAS